MFLNQYMKRPRIYANPGSAIKPVYSAHYNSRGVLVFEQTGFEDLYDFIQSHADSVDIHVLVERFCAGDKSALSRAQGFFADTTGMPKTYAEVLNSVLAGEQAFNTLPADIKRRFNNSFSEWLASMEDDDFALRSGFVSPPLASDKEVAGIMPASTDPAPPSPPVNVEPKPYPPDSPH